jgi:nucleotide-binding universal stress UspA family protein
MHVAEPVRSSSLGMAPLPPLPKGYRRAWESRLRLIRPRDTGVQVEHRLEEGDVATAIVRIAREVPCELIVMSGRQRTWLRGRLRGSITEEVERGAPCPVLRLHPQRQTDVTESTGGESRYKAILHPTDFSQPARLGFELAHVLAAESGSELIVAHVAPASALDGEKGNRDEIEAALRRMARSDPTVRGRWMLRTGDATAEILWMARQGWCDMIVMGTRDRGGLGRVFGRSIAAQVRWDSHCPVATVKLPHDRSADRQWRRKGDVPSNRDRPERQDEPGPSGPDRAASATPAEWMSA